MCTNVDPRNLPPCRARATYPSRTPLVQSSTGSDLRAGAPRYAIGAAPVCTVPTSNPWRMGARPHPAERDSPLGEAEHTTLIHQANIEPSLISLTENTHRTRRQIRDTHVRRVLDPQVFWVLVRPRCTVRATRDGEHDGRPDQPPALLFLHLAFARALWPHWRGCPRRR